MIEREKVLRKVWRRVRGMELGTGTGRDVSAGCWESDKRKREDVVRLVGGRRLGWLGVEKLKDGGAAKRT
jgi:hypothetical protein